MIAIKLVGCGKYGYFETRSQFEKGNVYIVDSSLAKRLLKRVDDITGLPYFEKADGDDVEYANEILDQRGREADHDLIAKVTGVEIEDEEEEDITEPPPPKRKVKRKPKADAKAKAKAKKKPRVTSKNRKRPSPPPEDPAGDDDDTTGAVELD